MSAGPEGSRWRELRALFDAVVELPEAERRAALERACGRDSARIDEVLALVGAAERGDGFLVPPARAASPPAGRETRVGHYLLERTLGAGSRGTVHLARSERDGTPVALRIVTLAEHAADAVDRLRRTAPLLARLDHPGLARTLETGLCAAPGNPAESALYFATELVPGGVRLADVDDPRRRLELFLAACDALGHAHAAGVAHGSPSAANVVVDAGGRARVLDLGVRSVFPGPERTPSAAHDRAALAQLLLALLPPDVPDDGRWSSRARDLARRAARTDGDAEVASVAELAERLRRAAAADTFYPS